MESHIIYEICAVVATLIFVGIGFYLILALKGLIETLKQINTNLSKIDPLTHQVARFLENSNEVVETVQDKLTDLDPLMESISDVGSSLKNFTNSFGQSEGHTTKFFRTEKKKKWHGVITDIMQLAALGLLAWQKIKKGS